MSLYSFIQIRDYSDLLEWDVKRYLQEDIASCYELKPLSSMLQVSKRTVCVEGDRDYKQAKIRLYGKGICLREIKKGKNIKTKKQYLIRQGQLLYSRIDARHGAFGIVPKELDGAIVTNSFATFDIDKKVVDPLYLILICTSTFFVKICEQKSSGTTGRACMNNHALLGIKIPIPPLNHQRKIVADYYDKMSRVDELEGRIIKLKESIKKLLATSLGIELLPNEGKSSKKVLQFFDYSSLVNGWGVHSLTLELKSSYYPMYLIKDLCKVGHGITPNRSVKEYYEGGDIPWFKSGELTHNPLYISEEKITEAGLRSRFGRVYPRNSLVIAICGATIGKTGKLKVVGTTNQACATLFDYDERIFIDFLWFYLQNQTEHLKKMAYGSAQSNLNINAIRDYPIPLPPLDEQIKMVEAIMEIKCEIAITEREVKHNKVTAQDNFEKSLFNEIPLKSKLMTEVV